MGLGNNIKDDELVKVGYGKWCNNIEEIVEYYKAKIKVYFYSQINL